MFMGDDGNSNVHMSNSYDVSTEAEANAPGMHIKRVYWDAYERMSSSTGFTYPDVEAAVKQQQQNGALVMNYMGHGTLRQLSHETVLTLYDFQNFTNTYGDPLVLKQKYLDALAAPDIVGVDIATRPDCLGPEILEAIKELSQKTFVTVELGLQTVHQKTADWMRRGYPTNVYFDTVAALKKECPAVHIVTQLILGLPGESDGDMLESVRRVVEAGSDGIKLTVLYVLAGTDLEKEWRAGKFECLSKEKYFELLKKIVPLLPPDMVVHRLTGDGPKKILLAPEWTKNKRQVLNELAALHLM
jgi:radical SAM protein (TIGR01212 family)